MLFGEARTGTVMKTISSFVSTTIDIKTVTNAWVQPLGGPDLPKIWTDPPTFYIAFDK